MRDVGARVTPQARTLPSNAAYLGHLEESDGDRSLIRLASNESTEPPSPRVRAALTAGHAEAHRYPPPVSPLRRRLAEQHGFEPAGVLVGAGATEPIDAALRCFAAAGDDVVVPAPSWPVYLRRLAVIGATVRPVPLRRSATAFAYDVDAMVAAVTPATAMVVVCSPNNPTGNTIAPSGVERIARTGTIVLVDNAYADFAPPGDAEAMIALARRFPNVLVARTFSKAYSLAGLRVGYLVCDPGTADYVDRLAVPGWSVGGPAQAAALAALEDVDHVRRHIDEIVRRRAVVLDALRAGGLEAYDSTANFVAVGCRDIDGGADALVAAFRAEGLLIRRMADDLARITVPGPAAGETLLAAIPRVARSVSA